MSTSNGTPLILQLPMPPLLLLVMAVKVVVLGCGGGCGAANPAAAVELAIHANLLQAGGDNKALDITVPAGITRLFKSNLDWQLYSDNQEQLDDRKVGPPFPAMQSVGNHQFNCQ